VRNLPFKETRRATIRDTLNHSKFFINEAALREDYVPKEILFRENEYEDLLLSCFTPYVQGSRGTNIVVYGKSGTGKTVTVKKIIQEIKELIDEKKIKENTKPIYLQCSTFTTPYSLACFLAKQFNPDPMGTLLSKPSISDYLKHFLAWIEKNELNVALVLDEIDKTIPANSDGSFDRFFYILSRAVEMDLLKKGQLTILLITNNMNLRDSFTPAVISSFGGFEVFFKNYDPEQVFVILKERAKEAMYSDILDDAALHYLAARAMEFGGDIRKAISILNSAAYVAKINKRNKIGEEEINKALEKIDWQTVSHALNDLKDSAKEGIAVLQSVLDLTPYNKDNPPTITKIQKKYEQFAGMLGVSSISETSLRRDLDYFVDKNILSRKLDIVAKGYCYLPMINKEIIEKAITDVRLTLVRNR